MKCYICPKDFDSLDVNGLQVSPFFEPLAYQLITGINPEVALMPTVPVIDIAICPECTKVLKTMIDLWKEGVVVESLTLSDDSIIEFVEDETKLVGRQEQTSDDLSTLKKILQTN